MKVTAEEFAALPQKRITLIGMSGSGKSYLTGFLDHFGWERYSCDYQIGSDYLKDKLSNRDGFSVHDITALAAFIGKLGNPDLDGYPLDLFKARQKAYYDAECAAIAEVSEISRISEKNFVHDSTGSLCEILDEDLIARIGAQTLFVYLEAAADDEKDMLQRAQDYPKPLFFPPHKLDEWIDEFMAERDVECVEKIIPDDFVRWVFPKLFESRKPKYKRLADMYGVTIPSRFFLNFKSEKDFLDIIAMHLD